MTIQSPWGQASVRKKRKKHKAKKVRRKKKVPVRKKRKKARRSRVRGDRVIVSRLEFAKIRKTVARPRWIDLLEENKRKLFKHDGRTYWPVFSLLYAIDAVEVVPLKQWGRATHRECGDRFRSGFVKKIGTSKYVFAKRAQFILRGSPLDV